MIRFWKDTWLGDMPLCDSFKWLFYLEKNKDCLVRDLISSWSWMWDWLRTINVGRSQVDFICLLEQIGYVEVVQGGDACMWSLSLDGEFPVSSVRHHIGNCVLPSRSPCTR